MMKRKVCGISVVLVSGAILTSFGCSSGPTAGSRQTTRTTQALLQAIDNEDIDGLRSALTAGADANHVAEGRPALWHAIQQGNVILVKELLKAGANIHTRTSPEGDSLLGAAALSGGPAAIVKVLLAAGADPNERFHHQDHLTPLGAAALAGNAAACVALIQAGAVIDAWNLSPSASYSAQSTTGEGVGRTALMIAASRGHVDIVVVLINYGADPNLKNERGQTALDLTSEDEARLGDIRDYLRKPDRLRLKR